MKKNSKLEVGRWGEKLAEDFFKKIGFLILDRNVWTKYGEIDLIIKTDSVTIFVEVKTRTGIEYGMPEESLTEKKRMHMKESAEAYIQDHPALEGDWRIDVIAIEGKPGILNPKITWFENAI